MNNVKLDSQSEKSYVNPVENQMINQQIGFNDIQTELIYHVFSYLSIHEFKNIIKLNSYWNKFIINYFSEELDNSIKRFLLVLSKSAPSTYKNQKEFFEKIRKEFSFLKSSEFKKMLFSIYQIRNKITGFIVIDLGKSHYLANIFHKTVYHYSFIDKDLVSHIQLYKKIERLEKKLPIQGAQPIKMINKLWKLISFLIQKHDIDNVIKKINEICPLIQSVVTRKKMFNASRKEFLKIVQTYMKFECFNEIKKIEDGVKKSENMSFEFIEGTILDISIELIKINREDFLENTLNFPSENKISLIRVLTKLSLFLLQQKDLNRSIQILDKIYQKIEYKICVEALKTKFDDLQNEYIKSIRFYMESENFEEIKQIANTLKTSQGLTFGFINPKIYITVLELISRNRSDLLGDILDFSLPIEENKFLRMVINKLIENGKEDLIYGEIITNIPTLVNGVNLQAEALSWIEKELQFR